MAIHPRKMRVHRTLIQTPQYDVLEDDYRSTSQGSEAVRRDDETSTDEGECDADEEKTRGGVGRPHGGPIYPRAALHVAESQEYAVALD